MAPAPPKPSLFLDFVLQTTTGRSLIDIGYANRSRIIVVPAWYLASGVVGVLAVLLQIVHMTFPAAVTVAIGWPLVFAKIAKLGSAPPAPSSSSSHRVQEWGFYVRTVANASDRLEYLLTGRDAK